MKPLMKRSLCPNLFPFSIVAEIFLNFGEEVYPPFTNPLSLPDPLLLPPSSNLLILLMLTSSYLGKGIPVEERKLLFDHLK